MKYVLSLVTKTDPVILAASGIVVLILIAVVVLILRRRALVARALNSLNSDIRDEDLAAKILSRPGVVRALIRKKGPEVMDRFGLFPVVLKAFRRRTSPENARKILELKYPEGHFQVFRIALTDRRIRGVFSRWLEKNGDFFSIENLASASDGKPFHSESAHSLLSAQMDIVRELSGSSLWNARYFSFQILLHDTDSRSLRNLKDAFRDPHPLIRRTVAEHFPADIPSDAGSDRTGDEAKGGTGEDFLFGALMSLVLDDPVPEVRKSARTRIEAEFPSRWKLDPAGMDPLQEVHVLELLKTGSSEDENVAVHALLRKDRESRLAAARFLEKSGALKRIFEGASRGDREEWDRRLGILSNAVEVGVRSFLSGIDRSDRIDVLLLASRLLENANSSDLVGRLVSRAFEVADPTSSADQEELYRRSLELACRCGDDKARSLLNTELRKRRQDGDLLSFILPLLPVEQAVIFRDTLLDFLTDDALPADEAYLDLVGRIPAPLLLGPILDILESDRSKHSHTVRERALRCLGGWKLDHTLQMIMENLPVLSERSRESFSAVLDSLDRKKVLQRAEFILDSPDAGMRAALIACLSPSLATEFRKRITDGLADPDPGVRLACLSSLVRNNDLKARKQILAMLADPVDDVRLRAAAFVGAAPGGGFVDALKDLVLARDESPKVKKAAIAGLASGDAGPGIDTLVDLLDGFDEPGDGLQTEIVNGLSKLTDRKSILSILEHFKDGEIALREKLMDVFIRMGSDGESQLVDLLKEDIPSLKPQISRILTQTGYAQKLIRKLGHRQASERIEAARVLAEIGTEEAYRGIILAARDPDREVRIRVTRALESLAEPEGEAILRSLQADPDRKVRRYTLWAIERLKAGKLP